ncbi:MAG: acyltransferase [Bacteroidota bacterium]
MNPENFPTDFLAFAQIRDVKFGKNVKVIKPVNMYECEIGDDCLVAAFSEIQKNVKVGNRTRIQSHSFICEGVTIGDDCFVSHGVMFVNDLFKSGRPAYNDKTKWIKINVGNNVTFGTKATIMANICDDVVIGAGAVVTTNITKPGIYAGIPARFIRTYDKNENRELIPEVLAIKNPGNTFTPMPGNEL